MNLYTFERMQSESYTETESDGAVLAQDDLSQLKQKIDKRKKKQKRAVILFGGLVVLILCLTAFSLYSWYQMRVLAKRENESVAVSSSAIPKTGEEIVKALGRHIIIPTGNPQIAEVEDATALKTKQAFFKDTQNGDFVIVYETMIYVYRPSADIVVAASDISGVGQAKP